MVRLLHRPTSIVMTISYKQLEEVAYELNRRAAIAVPLDARQGFDQAAKRVAEPGLRKLILKFRKLQKAA